MNGIKLTEICCAAVAIIGTVAALRSDTAADAFPHLVGSASMFCLAVWVDRRMTKGGRSR